MSLNQNDIEVQGRMSHGVLEAHSSWSQYAHSKYGDSSTHP